MGALLDVFAICYDRESDLLPPEDVDVAAEHQGFADAMFEVDLAEQTRGKVRIKGARERIKYLANKSDAGHIGGVKSGESRRNRAKQNRSNTEAGRNPPDPVPDLPPDPVPDTVPEERERRPRGKRAKLAPSAAELKVVRLVLDRLSHYSGVRYGGAAEHERLIVGRLRDGYTQGELRAVIAMQAEDWKGDPKMGTYLRPETLFGSTAIQRYIDRARTRYADLIAKADAEHAQRQPQPPLKLDGGDAP